MPSKSKTISYSCVWVKKNVLRKKFCTLVFFVKGEKSYKHTSAKYRNDQCWLMFVNKEKKMFFEKNTIVNFYKSRISIVLS